MDQNYETLLRAYNLEIERKEKLIGALRQAQAGLESSVSFLTAGTPASGCAIKSLAKANAAITEATGGAR